MPNFRIALAGCASLFALLGTPLAQQNSAPLGAHTWGLEAFEFDGPGIAITAIGPTPGEPLVGATLDVSFDASAAMPASDLWLYFSMPLGDGGVSWSVTGADLGFPEASGTYSASLTTDLFHGVVPSFAPMSISTMEILIQGVEGPLYGTLEFEIEFEIAPLIETSQPTVSLSGSDVQDLELHAGPSLGAGLGYLVLGSASGSGPGIDLGGVVLPLVVDPYTTYLLSAPQNPVLSDHLGILDNEGRGRAQLQMPAGLDPAWIGHELHHAFLVVDLEQGGLLAASDAASTILTP